MAKNEAPLLEILNISVSYGSITAVKEVSLRVEKGEVVTLIGANGAGKSTVLKAVLGIRRPDRGTILFKANDITRLETDQIVSSGLALVPEGRGIIMEMSVIENLELGAYHRQSNITEDLEKVFVQFPILRERKQQKAGLLSGGQQQMLAIGRAMMAKPLLIMMDEPSLGLAPIIVDQVFKTVSSMKSDHTILLAEQNARKALRISDRGYVFEKGLIVLEGTSGELLENDTVHRFYLGG